ncbi:MAG: DUF3623 family protein, partial [Pseudomonadota bacterium]
NRRKYRDVTGLRLAVLTALALIEHLFMVLPIPDQKLWRWMLPEAATVQPTKQDT